MPSLRMKKNSSVCCLMEKDSLHVCKTSNMITKRSSSHLKVSQLAAEAGTCQSCDDVSPSSELNNHDTGTIGATNRDELLGGENIQFKRLPTSSDDCFMIEGTELPTVSCFTNLETIFSPTLGHVDARNVPNSYDSSGCNIDQDLFRFSATDESDGNSGSSSDHKTCNISDFYISDMVLSGLPFDGSSVCDGVAETLMFPEYDTAESNIFFDITDGRITSPFLDDFAESSERLDVQPSGEARVECDSSSFLLAIHQVRPGDQEADLRPYVDSDEAQYFDPHSFIRNLPDLSDVVPNGQPTMLPKESRDKNPTTLVLDLDETLVHSTLEQCEDADFTFTVFFNMKEHSVYVKERPHLREFLKKVASMFEVVVFTASQSIYAEQLLDILDPEGKLISGRAYRESCIFSDGSYTKDLTVLGLDLAKVVIIDNSPQVFRLQVNNGIPIKSWFDDPSDNELVSLIPFLETLADADDVRPLIAKRFGNKD